MISIMETNNTYTKIPNMKEADFHSNTGKSGSNCNYGNSTWKGSNHPTGDYVFPKVTLYNYEELIDGELDPSSIGINSLSIDTTNSVTSGMFCEKPQIYETYIKSYSNSRIYPLGSDIDGYYLNDFYSTVGLQSKVNKLAHKTYVGSHLSKDCPSFYDGVRPWKSSLTNINLKVIDTSNTEFLHCSYKNKASYLFIDKDIMSIDVKRNEDGTMNKTYYTNIDSAFITNSFSPSSTSGYICFSILGRGNLDGVQIIPYVEGNNLTIDNTSVYISEGVASIESIILPNKWERVHYIIHYTSNSSLNGTIKVGLKVPLYYEEHNNLSLGISLCGGIISETSYPLVWNSKLRDSKIPTSISQINFDLIPEGDSYKDNVNYLSSRPWTITYKRKIEASISSITDIIGRLKITTTVTPSSGSVQMSSISNEVQGNNNDYTLDYSDSPYETVYIVFNGTNTLYYYLYNKSNCICYFTQDITSFSNCLDSIFIEETDNDGNIITKNKKGEDIKPIRISAILGGEFTTISSDNKVRDTNLDVSLCDIAYSDFIFIDEKALSQEEISKIENSYMTVHDSYNDSSARSIVHEYTIFEEKTIQNSDGSTINTISYAGVLEEVSPINTQVMYASKFIEK